MLAILGLIPRKCPSRPLAELWWDVQECSTDMDCWPRVCCPDGRRRYCRTSQPELETASVPVKRSFDYRKLKVFRMITEINRSLALFQLQSTWSAQPRRRPSLTFIPRRAPPPWIAFRMCAARRRDCATAGRPRSPCSH